MTEAMKETKKNLNFTGKINVISAFPATGKSYANDLLNGDYTITSVDLESTNFRKKVEHVNTSADDAESWENLYAAQVQNLIHQYRLEQRMSGDYSKTYFIFVAAYRSVREALSNNRINFYYLYPGKEMHEKMLLPLAEDRAQLAAADYEDCVRHGYVPEDIELKRKSTGNALKFMKEMAPQIIDKILNGEEEMPRQTIIELEYEPPKKDLDEFGEFVLDLILRHTRPSSTYMMEHRLSSGDARMYQKAMFNFFMDRTKLKKIRYAEPDGMPSDTTKKLMYQIGFDHYGRIVAVMETRKFQQWIMDDGNVPMWVEPMMGYFGLDSVMMSKPEFARAIQAIEKYHVQNPTDDELSWAYSTMCSIINGILLPYYLSDEEEAMPPEEDTEKADDNTDPADDPADDTAD